ncbi:hypothetical protein CS060_13140 [Anoxybacillus flavithermus]|uniref:Uncharacterized protein n=1 Tax=Anoxybacillus flavithermus TaxID=33934 RepID=A0A2G5RMD2_9BACL|nr:hypothetical protein JS80_01850 [Anoxybacillus sp. KU2-6(11)]PIC03821.1 hypothetical protein CS060_13140 [Anoxybacillus flavithermus]
MIELRPTNPRKRLFDLEQYEKKQKKQIEHLLEKQKEFLSEWKALKKAFETESDAFEKKRITYKMQSLERRIEMVKEELKKKGYKDNRGRPKKEAGTTYKEQRVKFTAHLLPETIAYLKALKEKGVIPDLSSFLDELVRHHKNETE